MSGKESLFKQEIMREAKRRKVLAFRVEAGLGSTPGILDIAIVTDVGSTVWLEAKEGADFTQDIMHLCNAYQRNVLRALWKRRTRAIIACKTGNRIAIRLMEYHTIIEGGVKELMDFCLDLGLE